MKKIIVFLMGIFLLVSCSSVDSTNTGNNTAMSNYSTTDLIVGTILATALYNNYGVSTMPGYGYGVGVGESKIKSHTNEVSNSHTTRSMGSDGSINTRTVTHTTTKTKSKGMSYGIGF